MDGTTRTTIRRRLRQVLGALAVTGAALAGCCLAAPAAQAAEPPVAAVTVFHDPALALAGDGSPRDGRTRPWAEIVVVVAVVAIAAESGEILRGRNDRLRH